MVAAAVQEHPNNHRFIESINEKLLYSAAIYGANASGKSNLLNAAFLLGELLERVEMPVFDWDDGPRVMPFLLDQKIQTSQLVFRLTSFAKIKGLTTALPSEGMLLKRSN